MSGVESQCQLSTDGELSEMNEPTSSPTQQTHLADSQSNQKEGS